MMDIAAFREAFPEFSNATTYPDSQIEFWADFANDQFDEARWGKLYIKGTFLFVAHCITLAAINARAGASGLTPGGGGAVTSKTVSDTSVNYDVSQSFEKSAGWFNRTVYGQMYIRLADMIGAGCSIL